MRQAGKQAVENEKTGLGSKSSSFFPFAMALSLEERITSIENSGRYFLAIINFENLLFANSL